MFYSTIEPLDDDLS